jgi:hypothetical protein
LKALDECDVSALLVRRENGPPQIVLKHNFEHETLYLVLTVTDPVREISEDIRFGVKFNQPLSPLSGSFSAESKQRRKKGARVKKAISVVEPNIEQSFNLPKAKPLSDDLLQEEMPIQTVNESKTEFNCEES